MNQEPKTLSSLDEFQQERLTRWILHGASLGQLQLWLDQEFYIQVAPSVLAEHREHILNQLIQLVAIPNLPIPKTSQATQNSPATATPPNNLPSEILNLRSEILNPPPSHANSPKTHPSTCSLAAANIFALPNQLDSKRCAAASGRVTWGYDLAIWSSHNGSFRM